MKKGFWFFKMGLMMLLFMVLFSALVMYLWNWLMPEIFGLRPLTIYQAGGLLLLSKIIFGFGKKGGPHGGPPWKHQWSNKWQHLSDEQKEVWKEKFKDKWCSMPPREEKETE